MCISSNCFLDVKCPLSASSWDSGTESDVHWRRAERVRAASGSRGARAEPEIKWAAETARGAGETTGTA